MVWKMVRSILYMFQWFKYAKIDNTFLENM